MQRLKTSSRFERSGIRTPCGAVLDRARTGYSSSVGAGAPTRFVGRLSTSLSFLWGCYTYSATVISAVLHRKVKEAQHQLSRETREVEWKLGSHPLIDAAAHWSTCPDTAFVLINSPQLHDLALRRADAVKTLICNVVTALSARMMLVCGLRCLKVR